MKKRTNHVLGWLAIALLAFAAPALAGHHEGSGKGAGQGKGPSPEQRAKMAEHHERMAACLRSDRPIGECRAQMRAMHEEMRKQCEAAGEGDCPMGHPGPHHGRHGAQDGKAKDKGEALKKGKADAPKKGKADATTEETAPQS